MSVSDYYPDRVPVVAGTEQSGHTAVGAGFARSGIGCAPAGTEASAVGSAEDVLQQVVSGLPGGTGLRALRAGIDSGHRVLGNRTFLRWVGEWQGGAPLQLMTKKKKKQEDMPEGEEKAQAAAAAMPGPGGQTQSDPEAPLPQEQPGEAAGPGQKKKKKKKKSRVQVALNTLRGEGVEAFRGYMEAEIGEAELLRTLVERITRAEDLGGARDAALRVVDERLRALDPETDPAVAAVGGPRPGQVVERPDSARVKTLLSKREKDLFDAVGKGDVGWTRRLLKHGNIDINVMVSAGPPLGLASYKGHAAIVRELLSVPGIDVNLAATVGVTPLYLAVQCGHVEVVKLLLAARGINVNLATGLGATPLYIAAQMGHVEVVKLLLAARGINVNSATGLGATPLYIAVQQGHVEMVKLLLAAPGINVNTATSDKIVTPLFVAAIRGHKDIVRLLLDAPNIDIDAREHTGATPLFVAAQYNFTGIVEQLVKKGADVNLALDDGTTPLCSAAFEGHIEVVRVLLQAPAIEPDLAMEGGVAPLAIAAMQGHKNIVRLLLRKGADPNFAYTAGIVPLHLACLYGHMAIAEMLLHAGADMDAETTTAVEYTPCSLARLAGHREVMSVLAGYRRRGGEDPVRLEGLDPCLRPQGLPLHALSRGQAPAEEAGETVSIPAVHPDSPGKGSLVPAETLPAATASVPPTPVRSGEGVSGADAPSPLAQARDALRQEVLDKLRGDNLKPLEGIRLLEDVNASTGIDGLCTLYNRLAGIERQKERARRRGRRQEVVPVAPGPAAAVAPGPVAAVAPVFSLGERTGLDAEAVEDEIMRHLAQRYHRFVGQAVNDMEFGRGKPTRGYPGLWHASAGISGVGSCSVFYYLDGSGQQVRIVGAGHHVGPAAYRLDYGADELGGTVLQLMLKKKQEGEPEGEEKAQAAAAALPGSGGQTQSDPEAPLPQEQPGEAAGPGQKKKKKKKKSRVQVALNTLRGEGVEAFRGYIEAEIGEAELLRTLVERIMRAEDLGGIKAEALALAEARMRLLDPQAGPVTVQAAGSVQGQVAEKAVVVPVKSDLNQKERILLDCCAKGDMKTLRRLLRYGNIDINIGNRWGTPLCFAAYYGHVSIVRELLSRPGRDVNLANEKGGTPLYLAAQRVHVEVVKLLLAARGINVNMANDQGATPLYIAAQLGHVEVVKLLLGARGINVNSAMSARKTTPLIIACHLGREDVVRLLLDAPNIGIDARKVDGATALYIAAQENHPRIVEQLVKRGANVNMEMNSGSTPLCDAAYKGHVEVVRILLRAPSIRVDQITKQGITPLAFASQEGHKDIIRLLLRKGAGLNKANQFGETPLHLACLRGHTGVVEILLHLGADADAHAKVVGAKTKNYTAYGLAELAGHREVMSVLAAHRRREEDKRGSTTSPASPEAASLPLATAATRAEQTCLTSPEEIESRVTGELGAPGPATAGTTHPPPTSAQPVGGVSGADAPSPLAQARDALRQEVLDKLRGDNLKPLEGIRLLEDVNASTDVDGLCTLYNRLAGIERQKERARRRGRRQEVVSVAPGPAAAPVFSLGERTGLDAEAVEDEIMRHLAQRYRRFVGQAVNDMEFGRGKPTRGYPGLWHASAGISGVGSCSVFYYLDGSGQQVRIVGAGHHVGPAAYQLDYAAGELGRVGRVLRIA